MLDKIPEMYRAFVATVSVITIGLVAIFAIVFFSPYPPPNPPYDIYDRCTRLPDDARSQRAEQQIQCLDKLREMGWRLGPTAAQTILQ